MLAFQYLNLQVFWLSNTVFFLIEFNRFLINFIILKIENIVHNFFHYIRIFLLVSFAEIQHFFRLQVSDIFDSHCNLFFIQLQVLFVHFLVFQFLLFSFHVEVFREDMSMLNCKLFKHSRATMFTVVTEEFHYSIRHFLKQVFIRICNFIGVQIIVFYSI